MKHIIAYTNNIASLRSKSRAIRNEHSEIVIDENDNVLLSIPKIIQYNEINGVTHSVSLMSYIDPYDRENGNALFGLMKAFENELTILAVGDTRTEDIYQQIFSDPVKTAMYDLAYPIQKDENGNDIPRHAFGVFDLTPI